MSFSQKIVKRLVSFRVSLECQGLLSLKSIKSQNKKKNNAPRYFAYENYGLHIVF